VPDAYERTLTEVFPQTSPGNFTWDPELDCWVWTTFNSYQWDLNWANPDVLCEFVQIVLNLANRGVDCLRLDAIAFLWKRMGTNCQNQPEVHAITQALRAVAHIAAPALIFKAEAIVPPPEVVSYFGQGRHSGRLSELAYHNSLMVQIWSALATRDARLLAVAAAHMASIPPTTAWATYLRCHDDIGWAIQDEDCAVIGWNGGAHRSFLSDFYTGHHEASFAEGLVFELNPVNGDRRVNGTAASLAGVGRSDQPLAVDRLSCAYAMVFGFGGVPLMFSGDEVALLNDPSYLQEPEHARDSRWVHRPHMPWNHLESSPHAHEVFSRMRHMISVRKGTESLHASVSTQVMPTSVKSVVCFVRKHPAGPMLQVYNVADYPVSVPLWELDEKVPRARVDALTGDKITIIDGMVHLAPYAAQWLVKP
jgi:amylosucrase